MIIRVMIVDDSVLFRKLASDVAGSFDNVEIVGCATTGDIALKKLAHKPTDLVFCDIHMPGLNGVETLERIKKDFPNTLVVMMSNISDRGADITIKALEMGAIDFIRKPNGHSLQKNLNQLKSDMKSILQIVSIKLNVRAVLCFTKKRLEKPVDHVFQAPISQIPISFSIIAVGVSTGGPEALSKFIPALPPTLSVPVVIVQHMPQGFTKSMAESLNRKSAITVVEAEEGMILNAGTVYIAQGGMHMVIRKKYDTAIIGINDGPPENSCKPAVDVLFRSVANVYGDRGVLSVVLTGMGADGENGVRTLKRKKCLSLTQSEDSCVVYGMPRAIDKAGLSDKSLPIDKIAEEIKKRIRS